MQGKNSPTLHHRCPKSLGGGDRSRSGRENTIYLRKQYHQAWHLLFANLEAVKIAEIINKLFLDPDYEFICQKRQDRPVRGE